MILIPWEELHFNINQYGLVYENDNIIYILDYSKLVQLVIAWFLDEKLKALEVNEEVIQIVDDKCMEHIPKC